MLEIRGDFRRSKLSSAGEAEMHAASSFQALRREGSVLRPGSMPSASTRFFWNAR
jgi:hypothetical protein